MLELGRALGLQSGSYIGNVESGRTKPPTLERCKQIADALRLTTQEREQLFKLAAQERTPDELKHFIRSKHFEVHEPSGTYGTKKLYLLGEVPAGPIKPTADYVEGFINIDANLVGNKDCFALRVKGDCLKDKQISSGDIVIVARGVHLENGNIAVVRIHEGPEENCTMKIFRKRGDDVWLMPASSDDKDQMPIPVKKDSGKQVEIIGKVIWAIKSVG